MANNLVRIKRMDHRPANLPLPAYATRNASGLDLCAIETAELAPGETRLFKTGLQMEIPIGLEGQIRPRSGLVLKHKITVANSPGTIDADYRGEIGVILRNESFDTSFKIEIGDRIAQLVFAAVPYVAFDEVQELSTTARESGGFGSTGGFGRHPNEQQAGADEWSRAHEYILVGRADPIAAPSGLSPEALAARTEFAVSAYGGVEAIVARLAQVAAQNERLTEANAALQRRADEALQRQELTPNACASCIADIARLRTLLKCALRSCEDMSPKPSWYAEARDLGILP